jgi:hypothetical protein
VSRTIANPRTEGFPGTHLSSPGHRQDALYSVYYGGHGLKYQIVVSPCGLIEDCAGPYAGRIGDGRMVQRSLLNERLGTFCTVPGLANANFYVYGDPAYARNTFIDRPYRRANMTPLEEHHNALMSSVRVSVKQNIGLVTNNFPALDFVRQQRTAVGTVGVNYLVCVILTNMLTCARGRNQISDYFGVAPPTVAEFLRPRAQMPVRLVELGIFPRQAPLA